MSINSLNYTNTFVSGNWVIQNNLKDLNNVLCIILETKEDISIFNTILFKVNY